MTNKNTPIILKNVHLLYQNISVPYETPSGAKRYTLTVLIEDDHPEIEKLKKLLNEANEAEFGKGTAEVLKSIRKTRRKTGETSYVLEPCAYKYREDDEGPLLSGNTLSRAQVVSGYYKPWDRYYRLECKTGMTIPPIVYDKDLTRILLTEEERLSALLKSGCQISIKGYFMAKKGDPVKGINPYIWFIPTAIQYTGEGWPINFEVAEDTEGFEKVAPAPGSTQTPEL
jgi:hypothetical protein